ncbi:putative nuclear division rft1 [Phaeomoniella chlamydospora]|uniref:Man(5)GlcNAc(2)-PP-dolichol translocation protein RFT1 n=1 Tax=Phaeomoniella chlamydospora TaxID=158046 RepID=A0A0G2F0N7_PHACM|nr:putative nuclear division rft1 [Phaeomoniella chlamydospora]
MSVSKGEENVEQHKTAFSGTSYLILIQLASRFFTFAGNQVLLRFLTPIILGVALQLDLYSVTVLYFSRESLRVALQRQPLDETAKSGKGPDTVRVNRGRQAQAAVNASYIACALGIPLAVVLAILYTQRGFQEVLDSPYFKLSLVIYGYATIIELLSEPAFVVIQQRGLYRSRAVTETWAACMKCLAACGTAFAGRVLGHQLGVLPFAIGQIAYANAILTGVKQLLSQADSVILVALSSLEDQGAFSLASNYGGLVARIVFQPIEESSRNSFGMLLAQDKMNGKSKDGLNSALRHLSTVLRFYSIISIFAFFFAPFLLPLLVKYVVGSRWFSPEVAGLLSSYAVYIPFMAFNGIAEAFVSSVASTADLRRQAIWMAGYTAIFGVSAYVFLQVLSLGARGLVYANAANMFFRTAWSWLYIQGYAKEHDARLNTQLIIPNPMSIATGVAVAAYLRTASQGNPGLVEFVIMIAVCGIAGIAIAFFERSFLLPHAQQLLPKRLAAKIDKARK